MVNIKENIKQKNDLVSLLFLLMIFSMYLVLRFNSFTELSNGTNVASAPKPLFYILVIPVAMGIALFYSALRASNKSLKCIYLVSTIPFIISPDVFSFINHGLLLLITNAVLTFLLVLMVLGYIIKNYEHRK
jgi:hypothetical protein